MQDQLRLEANIFKDIENIIVDYYPEKEFCERHGIPNLVRKTDTRDVRDPSLPPFTARKVTTYCPLCEEEAKGTPLIAWKNVPVVAQLTRGNSPFSMDVVTKVGRMKFLDCMRRDDIQETLLKEHGVYASDGALSNMGMEFLARVKCLHEYRFNRIRKDIEAGGGYILGLDGTGDGGSDRILAEMDLLRDWVLKAARIPSESTENIKPHLMFLRKKLGLPLTGVCDLLSGMMTPFEAVMIGVPLKTCDYHFLDDIGRDLMEEDYMALRKQVIDSRCRSHLERLRKGMYHKAEKSGLDMGCIAGELRAGTVPRGLSLEACVEAQTYDVVSWMLRSHEDNKGMRFPYSLPYLNLYERCGKGLDIITAIRRMAVKGRVVPKDLLELESRLRDTLTGKDEAAVALRARAASVKRIYELFVELREKLHIPENRGDIPRDKLIIRSNEKIGEMRKGLELFREHLRELVKDGKHPKEKIVLDHLDRYWPNLVLDNVVVKVKGEVKVIGIPRTSGGNETLFGMVKTDLRKRLGKKDIGRELNNYGDYLCYVQNLKKDDYVSLICGTIEDLPRAFERLPTKMVKKEMALLRKRMKGYDITNGGLRGKKVEIEEIQKGIVIVDARVDKVLEEEYIRPPELYGRQSNGNLTL